MVRYQHDEGSQVRVKKSMSGLCELMHCCLPQHTALLTRTLTLSWRLFTATVERLSC